MSKSKKASAAPVPPPANLAWKSLLQDKLVRRLAIVAAVLLACGVVFSTAWQQWGRSITRTPAYLLDESKIEVTRQPPYIHANVKNDTIRTGGLTELSLLDPKLTEKVQHAFALHTWVASVKSVTKFHPARVVVEVEYRRPVAMIEITNAGERGLLPVDAYGVLLPPEDFSANQVRNYLRVSAGVTQPQGPVGTPWGDDRITAAAAIANAMLDHWQKLGLYRIELATAKEGEIPTAPVFDLATRDGARVIWGHAPGHEASGEATCGEKITQLLAFYEKQGPITAASEQRELNVRDGLPPAVKATPAAFQKP
ncbi:MAG TPA: hypothetical protein VL096_06605 [Pirellulaceae bacterium]|nr:hypothetical protein [Pirellulaceae bacterium]